MIYASICKLIQNDGTTFSCQQEAQAGEETLSFFCMALFFSPLFLKAPDTSVLLRYQSSLFKQPAPPPGARQEAVEEERPAELSTPKESSKREAVWAMVTIIFGSPF